MKIVLKCEMVSQVLCLFSILELLSLNFMFLFDICSPIIKSNSSKSIAVNLVKFRKLRASSSFSFSNKIMPYLGPSSNTGTTSVYVYYRSNTVTRNVYVSWFIRLLLSLNMNSLRTMQCSS